MTVTNRRRGADRRVKTVAVEIERRSGLDRRMIVESATAQIHAVLELLTQLADAGALRDDSRRLLDTAMLRLRFALERMEPE
jgi:energy-converting hydrogenase Eha subunit H